MLVLYSLICVQLFIFTKCTVLAPNDSIDDTFRQCLISQMPANLGHCLGAGTINRLRSLDSSPEFDLVDGLTLTRDTQEYRDAYNFDEGDPTNLRSIFNSFSHVFSKRNLKWNMGFLYPGLLMHIAPSGELGGTLEFILDPHKEASNIHTLKEAGTGRLLARQFLLPLLLGFKFNAISIIPILFGVVALVAKKFLLISKIALVISSAIALGTLLLGSGQGYSSQYYNNGQHGQFGNGGLGNYGLHGVHGAHGVHGIHGVHGAHGAHGVHGGHLGQHGFHGYTKFPEEDYSDSIFRESNKASEDQLIVQPNIVGDSTSRVDFKKGRNFAWNDDEKKTQVK